MDSFDYRKRAAAELIAWISATATERTAAAGSHLIREGDQAEALLFLLDGQLEAITSDAEQRDVTLGSLAAGAVIGEMSWLEQRPAVADIVSRSTCQLLELPFSSIQQLERSNPHLAAQLHRLLAQKLALQIQQQNIRLAGEAQNPVEPLRKVLTLFANLQQRDVHRLASVGSHQTVAPGAWLLRQGQAVSGLYLVLSGDGEIQLELDGQTRPVGKARRGELIGEMSLLLEEQIGASASVLAPEGMDVLTIELEKLRLELSSDASLDCRFHRAIACMLSQRSRDQLQRHQLGQRSQSRELAEANEDDEDSLDLQQLEGVSRGARHFDWLCRQVQHQGAERP